MSSKQEKEEYLEKLWYMKEDGTDLTDDLKNSLVGSFKAEMIEELTVEGLVELSEESSRIKLTNKGEAASRQLIRAHRLAERLINDVLGNDFEPGACEFEHIVTPELVDSICTLLGHPRECPHGKPIPKGDCCKKCIRSVDSSVIPVTELKVGQEARVAYLNFKNDSQLHKMDCLHIRPGMTIKVHQTYPTFVIECEGANIALDEKIACNICVWKSPQDSNLPSQQRNCLRKKRGWRLRRPFRFMGRKQTDSNNPA